MSTPNPESELKPKPKTKPTWKTKRAQAALSRVLRRRAFRAELTRRASVVLYS